MPRVRDLLHRFRPAGAPGPAGRVGVPADRVAESATELEPLFAELAGTEQECLRILEQAKQDADEIRDQGLQQAQALTAAARRNAASTRASTAAQRAEEAESEAQAESRAAEADVGAVQRHAADAMATYVDAVVTQVTTMIDGPLVTTAADLESA